MVPLVCFCFVDIHLVLLQPLELPLNGLFQHTLLRYCQSTFFGTLVDALASVRARGTVLDPDVVSGLLGRSHAKNRLDELSPRECEVLALIAEGRSNGAIARALVLTDKTIEHHIASIFTKLGLLQEPDDHRRVLAVLSYLGAGEAR